MSAATRKAAAFLLTALVLVLFFFLRGSDRIVLDLTSGDAVTVRGPGNISRSIPYGDIASVVLLEDFDRGACVSGESKRSTTCGTWDCAMYGEYTLIAMTKVGTHIAITDAAGQTLVFNYESDEVTGNLYELILELLAQNTPDPLSTPKRAL